MLVLSSRRGMPRAEPGGYTWLPAARDHGHIRRLGTTACSDLNNMFVGNDPFTLHEIRRPHITGSFTAANAYKFWGLSCVRAVSHGSSRTACRLCTFIWQLGRNVSARHPTDPLMSAGLQNA